VHSGGRQNHRAVGFEGLEDASLTAGPLTALAAALLERRHAVRNANQAAAAAQTEAYRSVILDALAHEFKTRCPPSWLRPALSGKRLRWGPNTWKWLKRWRRRPHAWAA